MSEWAINILTLIALAVICRIIGILLRRSDVGRTVLSFASKLMYLFVLGIIGRILGIGHLQWFSFFAMLIFLNLPISTIFWSIYQIVGMVITPIMYKFNLPSRENYVLKGDYILPFNGKWGVVNGGVSKELSHSWLAIPQRYAYDFVIFDDEGSYSGDKKSVQSYFCYGKDIIAPADGVVVKLIDRYKDSYVDGKNVYCDASRIEGNSITIKHNDSEYSVTAHIKQGSFKVKVGDVVKQGDVIAKCGNSGNSSEPHIHFQLQAGANFFLSAGLPIAFTNVNAQEIEGYTLVDKRSIAGNLQVVGNKSYIGRGLEVENATGQFPQN
jgi:hypothetical protein